VTKPKAPEPTKIQIGAGPRSFNGMKPSNARPLARYRATLVSMGSWLDKRQRRLLPSGVPSTPAIPGRERTGAAYETRFVPARWLTLLVGIAWTLFTRGKIAKLGLVGLVWSVTPKPVKIAAAGVVVTWVVVVAGALAAITLLALQVT
jgi:hypothetical protein